MVNVSVSSNPNTHLNMDFTYACTQMVVQYHLVNLCQ